MPFTEDCLDRGKPAPGVSDALKQLDRLAAVAEQLGAAELSVLVLVAERLLEGRRRYGVLNIDTDPRDFRKEAFEELADAAVYLAADLERGARR